MPHSSSLTRLLRLLAAILCGLGLGLAALAGDEWYKFYHATL